MNPPSGPLVSVLLPVRNAEAFLGGALASVLGQSLRDLEVVLVDDGSTDSSPAVAHAAAERDGRVRVVPGEGRGLVAALNLGLTACRGRYIARMDADDLCLPGRLTDQCAFMEARPEVGLVAGQIRVFGASGLKQVAYPCSHGHILAAALFDSPVAHPAVLFRASILPADRAAYDPEERHAEDYGLWSRWLRRGVRFAALPRRVLNYRVHAHQVNVRNRDEQVRVADSIRLGWLRGLGLEPTPAELALHSGVGRGIWGKGPAYLEALEVWLSKLRAAGRRCPLFEGDGLDLLVAQRWTSALWFNRGLGAPLRRLVRASALSGLPHPQAWKPWAAWWGSFLKETA